MGCPCTPLQLCNVSVAGSRLREEELRENLKREEARLEQMQAQMLKSQKRLIEFENIIDNLFLRMQGIVIPGQVHQGTRAMQAGLHGDTWHSHHCHQGLAVPTKVVLSPLGGLCCSGGAGGEAEAL